MRPTWDQTFISIARDVGKRSTCSRALELYGGIGAVITEAESKRVLGIGYCGSLPGQPHCTEVGCLIDPAVGGGCNRTIHAEMNAILWMRPSDKPKTLYTTVSPCLKCLQHAVVMGTKRVVFEKLYRNVAEQVALCKSLEIEWVHLNDCATCDGTGQYVPPNGFGIVTCPICSKDSK